MTDRRVVSGDVEIAVRASGDSTKPTIVLVHGFPDTSGMWDPVAERLALGYHVVAYDVRGTGSSSAPADRESYRMERLVEDLSAVIDATSPSRPAHVVGHDWGSIQSWEAVCTASLQGRIASFTSISGPSLDHAGRWVRERLRHPSLRNTRALVRQGTRSWYISAMRLPGWPAVARRAIPRGFPRYLVRREGVALTEDYPASTLADDAANGVLFYRANMQDRLTRPRPRRTNVPVQLIVPLKDPFVTPALLDGMERIAPRLWRRNIDASHWVPRKNPDLIARLVSEFVDHIEGGPETRELRRARVTGDRTFVGKLVVVTGAGSGIGRETALAFASRGAEVVAADIDPDGAARTANLARLLGASAHHYQVDVGDADAMEAFAKWVESDIGVAESSSTMQGSGWAARSWTPRSPTGNASCT